jgi:LEM-3-like GIY-YIG domain
MGDEFYVYGYFDPRNFRLFYVGKGRGSRKYSHLKESGESEKRRTVAAIHRAGLKPEIKVIASGLTEREAFLVESVLIRAFQPQLTNEIRGPMNECIRPAHTLHQSLAGFDTQAATYLVNVGDGPARSWEDCRMYGFISAGGARRWSKQLERLTIGDVIVPYLKNHGYIGIGRVVQESVPVSDFRHRGRRLSASMLKQRGLLRHAEDAARSEYLVGVKWIRHVAAAEAKFRRRGGLFTTQLVVAALAKQPRTLMFINEAFRVNLERLTSEI